jgi:putative isomerase
MYNISADRFFNTWSTKSPAVLEFLPARFLVVPGAYSFATGEYTEFPFSDRIKLYEHDHEARYLRLTMEHAGTVLQLQYWKQDPWTVRGRRSL